MVDRDTDNSRTVTATEAANANTDNKGNSSKIEDIARKLGEDPSSFTQRTDAVRVLEMMEDGVIVNLTVRRPRCQTKLTAQDLGLDDALISEAARSVLQEYIYLGKLSVLPKEYQNGLNSVESAARQCLTRYSIKSHWGAFVPLTNYEQWKTENAQHEVDFAALRDQIIENYDQLTEKGVEAYRPLALDIWQRTQKQQQTGGGGMSQETFVENYLERIRLTVPPIQEIIKAFEYRIEKSFIPLPSTLARDVEQAERIYKKRASQDAEFRAEQERIEREIRQEREMAEAKHRAEVSQNQGEQFIADAMRRATLEGIERKKRLEEARLQAEHRSALQKLQLQEQMERDVIESARQQRQELVNDFYRDVVGQINQLLYQVADSALGSLERNGGRLSGTVSHQLSNLVVQLEGWNFMQNFAVTDQIQRLRAVLPANLEYEATDDSDGSSKNKDKDKSSGLKLDTRPLSRVLSQLEAESSATLIELGHQPIKRVQRAVQTLQNGEQTETEQPFDNSATEPLVASPMRKARRRYDSIFAIAATPDNDGSKRRPRAKSKSGLSDKQLPAIATNTSSAATNRKKVRSA